MKGSSFKRLAEEIGESNRVVRCIGELRDLIHREYSSEDVTLTDSDLLLLLHLAQGMGKTLDFILQERGYDGGFEEWIRTKGDAEDDSELESILSAMSKPFNV